MVTTPATATTTTTITRRKTRIHDSRDTNCPTVQLNSCADLQDYGLLDMPECTCQDGHGGGGGGSFACIDGEYVFCRGIFLTNKNEEGGEEPLSNDVSNGAAGIGVGGSTNSNSNSNNYSNLGSSGTSSATLNTPKQQDRDSTTTMMTTATLGIAGIVLVMVLVYLVSGRTQRRQPRQLEPPIFSEYRDHSNHDATENGQHRQTETEPEGTSNQVELGTMV
jgi:hypothetical protein